MQPYFSNFSDLMSMGGHGVYVWSSWSIAVITVVAMVIFSIKQRRALLKQIHRQQLHQKNRQNTLS